MIISMKSIVLQLKLFQGTETDMDDLQRDFEEYYRIKFALEIEDHIYNSKEKLVDEDSRWFFNGMRYAMMLLRHGYSP